MSTTTKIAPVVVAGIGGIIIGYLLAPDVDAVRDDFAARFNEQTPIIQQLQASVANIEARMEGLPDAQALTASIEEQLSAAEARLATQTDAISAQLAEGSEDETASGIEDIRGQMETLTQEVAALREDLAASAEAQGAAQAEPEEDAASQLASQIGASGAVLLPGQGAIFGGSRLDLSDLDFEAGTASITPEGGEAQDVAEGDTVQLSETCTVRLAGIASGAAYLGTEECGGGEGADAATGAEEAPAAEPAAEPEPEATGENAQQPAEGETPGTDVPAQGSQAQPGQQPGQAQENAPGAEQLQPQPQPAQ